MHEQSFEQALAISGIPTPKQRLHTAEFTRWGDNSRYWAKPIGDGYIFGDYVQGISESWFPLPTNQPLTPEQVEARKAQEAQIRASAEAELAKKHENAAAAALKQWEHATIAKETSSHPYLTKKQIPPVGAKLDGEKLLIPLYDTSDKLWSLQTIDAKGSKRFLPGGKKKACFFPIGLLKGAPTVYVCEGYATGASIHEATQVPTAVAFDAGNMEPVASAIHTMYPDAAIILCGDNDQWGERNIGKETVEAIGKSYGFQYVLPEFVDAIKKGSKPTDFNDLHTLSGLSEVLRQLTHKQDEHRIDKLAELSKLDYSKIRTKFAKEIGIPVATLDSLVKERRPERSCQDDTPFTSVELWPEEVNGEKLLDEISVTIRNFVICPEATAHATALWITMTWLMDAVKVSPLAVITAPEKRCGKSQLLTLIGKLACRPLTASNITPAALFRSIDAWKPTLLIDEADASMNENEELRGLLNAGHTRDSAFVVRVVGDNHEPKRFDVWGPKAIAGIGKLSDTLMDRAITLELRRKLAHEHVSRLRHADANLFPTLCSQLLRWTSDNEDKIARLIPELPEWLNDRAQDNWEPLLAIAYTAGGHWPETALKAARNISDNSSESPSTNTELLGDIKEVFENKSVERIHSADLIAALCDDDEKGWSRYNRGKPLSPRQLATRLNDYDIKSKDIRINYTVKKGYEYGQFEDAFLRYLATSPSPDATPLQTPAEADEHVADGMHCSATENQSATPKIVLEKDCSVVADKTPAARNVEVIL